jgi:2-oxoglutarate dehydrogenase E2 component (dihydrolipoamide succinyltransferase)
VIDVTVPKGGLDAEGMGVGRFLVGVGDRVAPGQALIEIETGKASVEVEAEVAGVVHEILLEAGQDVNVGDVILRLDETA